MYTQKSRAISWQRSRLFCNIKSASSRLPMIMAESSSVVKSSVVKSVVEQSPTLDRNQALEHLAALGYERGDTIYMRYINHTTTKSTKALKLDSKQAERLQRLGFNVYFVVNGGGDKDTDVRTCRAIFYEHDRLSKQEQLVLWQKLKLPAPTIKVDTGGRSIHSYWVFESPIPTEQWRELQSDLLEYSEGDRTLKNPSRVMRLAGAVYLKGNNSGSTIATIVSNSGERYGYEQLRSIIPSPQVKTPLELAILSEDPVESIQLPVPESVPLYVCLSQNNRSLYDSGVSEGGRNNNGAKLCRDLVGTYNYLQSIGQSFSGDPRQMLDEYASRCSPPLPSKEVEQIWKSALRDRPTPSCQAEGVEKCIRAWYWNNYLLDVPRSRPTNVIPHPAVQKNNEDGLSKAIDALVNKALSGSQLTIEIGRVAKQHQKTEKFIRELLQERISEIEQIDNRDETLAQIEQLTKANEERLNIFEILPYDLADPINKLATEQNLRNECYLTALLPAVATFHKVGTKVEMVEKWDFKVTPNLFCAIVAEPSQKKSPIFDVMVNKPFGVIQSELMEEHEQALLDYNQTLEDYNSLTKEERKDQFPSGPPKEPKPRIISVTHATNEGLTKQLTNHPGFAICKSTDELNSHLNGHNAYRGGRGSDNEDWLSFHDGKGITVARADGIRAYIKETLISLVGTTQPAVLEKAIGDGSDPNGMWSRICFAFQPLAACEIGKDGPSLNLTDRLASYFRKIDSLPVMEYKLTAGAKEYYSKIYKVLDQKRVSDPIQAMRAVWGKTEGRIGKLAINLHVLHEIAAGRTPSEYIPKEIIVAAKKLAVFYAHQIQSLYCQFDNGIYDNLAPNLVKVLEMSKQKGWIAARDVQRSISSRSRPTSATVKSWFEQLVKMGKGEIRSSGRSVEFMAPNVTQVAPNVNNNGTSESYTEQASHPIGTKCHSNVTNGTNFSNQGNFDSWCEKVEPSKMNGFNPPLINECHLVPNSPNEDTAGLSNGTNLSTMSDTWGAIGATNTKMSAKHTQTKVFDAGQLIRSLNGFNGTHEPKADPVPVEPRWSRSEPPQASPVVVLQKLTEVIG